MNNKASNEYKQNYIQIAEDLHYPDEVIKKLKLAKTDIEKTRIMTTQRRKEKSK